MDGKGNKIMRCNMNKKLLSLLFFSILVLSMLPKVSADYATNITSTPGAVSCIIEFDAPATDSYIRIYYGKSTGIDATDNMTYRDPDLCTYGERTHRKMLIRGLTEDTTYYYRLRDTEIDEWLSDELSFTTLSRFTNDTGWKDEFFDLYLVDSNSSGLVIDQQVGTSKVHSYKKIHKTKQMEEVHIIVVFLMIVELGEHTIVPNH